MNPNWLGVLSTVLALAAFGGAYWVAMGMPVKRRMIFFFLALVAAIPGASFAAYYAHIFPEPSWYDEFRSIKGTELLIVFLGVAGGLAASLLPRMLLAFPLFGVAAFSVVPWIKPFIAPISSGAFRDEWDGEVCLQSTSSTCGAASTASILKRFGINVTESELAAEAHSYAGGTEAWYLARAVRSRGLDADFIFRSGFHPESGLPAVVGVRLGSIGHFIAVLGQEGADFIVGDPLRGRELLSRDELQKRYRFTGFHLRVTHKAKERLP